MSVRHQIVLIGRCMDTALLGVKTFHPDVLHLLYTDVTALLYEPLLRMLPEGVEVNEYRIDPYGVEMIMGICHSIKESLAPDDVLQYNLTEGTKVAAMAAFTVASSTGDPAVYYSQEGEAVNMWDFSRTPIDARISNEEFVDLFGNLLRSFNLASEILPVDIVTAYDVKRFQENNQKTYQRLMKQFRSDFGGRIEKLPSSFNVERERGMTVTIKNGELLIKDRNRVIFESGNPLATRLFFTGRWWEVIVSDIVYKWDLQRHALRTDSQVWRNVEFEGDRKGRVKNELDILVNDRRRLVMIECKSGYIAQENIYKIDSVRQTYGGPHSKGVLVSYYPLDPGLADKCDDLHVYRFAPENPSGRFDFIKGLPAFLDSVVRDIEA